MAKRLIILLCALLAWTYCYAADANLEKMEDSLARGYLAASKNDVGKALNYFKSATTYANKAGSWRGLIDCANAFSVLGKPRESMQLLKNSLKISGSKKDWRGAVATGYAYLALPEKLKVKNKAKDSFVRACKIAINNENWRGAIEGIKGLIESGEKEAAKAYLTSARKIVNDLKSPAGYNDLMHIYKKLGDNRSSSECFDLAGRYQKINMKAVSPPPGWKPAGPAIAGPEKVSAEAQRAMRYSADKEIEQKTQWMIEREKRERESQRHAYKYTTYYRYPYYYNFYGYWSPYTQDQLYSWAAFYLSRYALDDDDYYVYVGW